MAKAGGIQHGMAGGETYHRFVAVAHGRNLRNGQMTNRKSLIMQNEFVGSPIVHNETLIMHHETIMSHYS